MSHPFIEAKDVLSHFSTPTGIALVEKSRPHAKFSDGSMPDGLTSRLGARTFFLRWDDSCIANNSSFGCDGRRGFSRHYCALPCLRPTSKRCCTVSLGA